MVEIWRLETINIRLKRILSYKANTIFELVDIIFWIIINFYLWSAFKPNVNVLGYVITIASLSVFSYRSTINNILSKYRNGSIVFDLIRPKRFYSIIFWQWVGSIFSNNLLILPIIAIAIYFNPSIYFLISIILAAYLRFLIGFIGASLFYESYYSFGITALIGIIMYVTGGGLPFFLMPQIIKNLMLFNPLFYAMAAPWVSQYNPTIIIYQFLCLLVMLFLAIFLERSMLKNLTTVGV